MKLKIKFRLILLSCCVFFSASCQKPATEDDLVLIQIQDRNGLSETISNQEKLLQHRNTNFLASQPYKQVLRLYRKEGKNYSILTTYHPNGSIWQMLEAKEMRAFGAYREWFPNGAQKIEAHVIGGIADLTASAQETWLFDGISEVRNENGNLIARMLYDKGVLSGDSISYFPSGGIERETSYLRDRIEGEERAFWENGSLRSKTLFCEGQKKGSSLGFWPNGALSWEEEYDLNFLQRGTYWNLDHEMVSQVKDGFGFKSVFDSTYLIRQEEIRNGRTEGIVKCFDEAKQLRSIYHVKDGRKQGEEIEYYPSDKDASQPKLSLYWDQDAIHGTVKTWYENGQLQSQREIYKNKKAGISCAWYRDGSLMLLEEYENDQLLRGQYYRKRQTTPVSTVSSGNGIATLYDGDGIFLSKITYARGRPLDP